MDMDVSFSIDHVVRQIDVPSSDRTGSYTDNDAHHYRSWKKEKAKKEENNINSKPFGTTRPFF